MTHDNPYDQAEQAARDEDRRKALQEGAEEAENERRQDVGYWQDVEPTACDEE